MNLTETTFEQFFEYCKANKNFYPYINKERLRIIYEHMKKRNLICEGSRLTITYNGEWQSSFTEPLEHKPTKADFEWNLFHEVWCKAEWAIRCGIDEMSCGYEAVKAMFGMKTINQIKEVTA